MSSRPLSTSAGVPVIESMMRWTAGRTCCGAGLRGRPAGAAGGPDQVEQVHPLGVVELQRVRDAADDALRDAGGVAALEPGVVLGRDPGEDGDLLAAQARDPPVLSPVHGQPGLRGADPGPARAQERPDIAADGGRVARACHVCHCTRGPAWLGVPASTPLIRICHLAALAGCVDGATANDAGCGTSTREKFTHMRDKKVWLITGAGRGLGVDIARAALAAGDAVVATARKADSVTAALGEHDDLLAVKLDVTDPADAEAAVKATVERFGRLDVLVNNAG